jgi:hypothetical protein
MPVDFLNLFALLNARQVRYVIEQLLTLLPPPARQD